MAIQHLSKSKDSMTIEKGVVSLYANISIGATGAPSLVSPKCKGIASIVRSSAGKYVITTSEPYQYLMFLDAVYLNAGGTPIAANNVGLIVEADQLNVSGNNSVTIQFINAAGAAADLASGCVVLLKADVKYSTI